MQVSRNSKIICRRESLIMNWEKELRGSANNPWSTGSWQIMTTQELELCLYLEQGLHNRAYKMMITQLTERYAEIILEVGSILFYMLYSN